MLRSSELISSELSRFSSSIFLENLTPVPIYVHSAGGEADIGGGAYGAQTIQTYPFSTNLLNWFKQQVSHLDTIIDLDFSFSNSPEESSIDIYLDSEIVVNSSNNTLGIAVPNIATVNSLKQHGWWELMVNTTMFRTENQLKYALLHELGHALGLEHPFDSDDGDQAGIMFGEPDGNVTIMSYTKPAGGWPTYFSGYDLAALAKIWGLESTYTGHWLIKDTNNELLVLDRKAASDRLSHDIPGETLSGHSIIDLITSDPSDRNGALRGQAGQTVFFSLSEQTKSDPIATEAIRQAIFKIDLIIDLDFIEIIDHNSQLAQLKIELGDLSESTTDTDITLGLNIPSFESIKLGPGYIYYFDSTNKIIIDNNAFKLVSDSFKDYSVYIEHITLHELGHALGLRHPWEGNNGDINFFTTSDTIMAYRHEQQIISAQLKPADIEALVNLYMPESGAAYINNDQSLPTFSFHPIQSFVNSNNDQKLTTLRIQIERQGRQDLINSVLLELRSSSIIDQNLGLELDLQPIQELKFLGNQQVASIDIVIPTGFVRELQYELKAPLNGLLAEYNDLVINVHDLEYALDLHHIVNSRTDNEFAHTLIKDQGSEIIYYSIDTGVDQTWITFLMQLINEIDASIDLDFFKIESSNSLSQLHFESTLSEDLSIKTSNQTISIGTQNFALTKQFIFQLPLIGPETNSVFKMLQVGQEIAIRLGLERPDDGSDGDIYLQTKVLPKNSLMFNQYEDSSSESLLKPIDISALQLTYGKEDDLLTDGDGRQGSLAAAEAPTFSLLLNKEKSSFDPSSGNLSFSITIARNGSALLESRALIWASSWTNLPLSSQQSTPFIAKEFILSAGQQESSFEIKVMPNQYDSIQLSLTALSGASGTSMLDISQSDVGEITSLALEPPTGLGLAQGSDTGKYNTDLLTADRTPTITGKARPNLQISIYESGRLLGVTTSDLDGNWSYTPENDQLLKDGTQIITATATDAFGNSSLLSESFNFSIDSVAPILAYPDQTISLIESSGAGQQLVIDWTSIQEDVEYKIKDAANHTYLQIDADSGQLTMLADPNLFSHNGKKFIVVTTDLAGNSSENTFSLIIKNASELQPLNKSITLANLTGSITVHSSRIHDFDLKNLFDLSNTDGTVVKIQTNLLNLPGSNNSNIVYIELYDKTGAAAVLTQKTASNFLEYVSNGTYDQTIIHRSVPGFVVQGGGFNVPISNSVPPRPLVTRPPVQNEPGNSNLRGTIAMAKLGGDPNSATSQFFFNLSDSNSANLDYQNGGFTVFGQVLGNGMKIIDSIASTPTYDASGFYGSSAFSVLPLQAYQNGNALSKSNFVVLESIDKLAGDYELFQVKAVVTDPTLVQIDVLDDYRLRITPLGMKSGKTTATLTATSMIDQSVFKYEFDLNVIDPFKVKDIRPMPNGIALQLPEAPDMKSFNLYDGQDTSDDAADLKLTDPSGSHVALSAHWDAEANELLLLSADSLKNGSYKLHIDSRADGLISASTGAILDSNGDGSAGDSLATSFSIVASNHSLSISDTTRGAGQILSINGRDTHDPVSGKPLTASAGLPIHLSTIASLKSFSGTLSYDSSLLLTQSLESAITAGTDLPSDWNLSVHPDSTAGHLIFSAKGASAVTGTQREILRFQAHVAPRTASNGASEFYAGTTLIRGSLSSDAITGEAVSVDPGLIVLAYSGDTTGNGTLSSLDASRVQRVVVGLDTGFDAYDDINPVVIGDTTGNGSLSSLDASRIQQQVVGLDVTTFPAVPSI